MIYPRSSLAIFAAATLGVLPGAFAAAYTYTPSNGTSDIWSTGTNWSSIPASAMDARLTFVGDNTTVLADGLTNTNTDDVSGNFQLNILDLQGTGPAAGAATVTIASASPSTGLEMVSNLTSGTVTPVVNLNALAGASGLTYNVSAPVTLTNDTLFTGNGTANFNFSGGITSSSSLFKTGSSTLTLATSTVNGLEMGRGAVGGSIVMAAGSSLTIGLGQLNAELNIGFVNNGAAGTMNSTLDASATSNLNVSVGTIRVGNMVGGNGFSYGNFKLGANNSLRATSWILVGYSDNAFANTGTSSMSTAAGGTTTIQTPRMTIGGGKVRSEFVAGAGSTVMIAGLNPGERATFEVGNFINNIGGSGSWNGTANFSSATFSGTLNSLLVGRLNGSGSSSETGTLTLGASATNHFDISGTVNPVQIGKYVSGSGTAIGTVTIGNLDATSSVTATDNSTAILIGDGGVNKATGTLNLNGGYLTITTTGKAIGGGTGTSTVNFNGMTLKAGADSTNWISGLTNAKVLAGGAKFDTNNHNITIAQAFVSGTAGDGGLTKTGAGILTLSGTSTYVGATTVSAGTLLVSGALNGSTVLSVDNNATLQLDTNVSLNDSIQLTLTAGSTVNLNFSGAETIGQLLINGTFLAADNYTLSELQNLAGGVTFLGDPSASLTVSAVPEPTAMALFAFSGGVLLLAKRARSRRGI